MIDYTDTEETIEKCFDEINSASQDKYDSDKADRTAALFLSAQMKLSFLIEEVEMKAKQAKNEISRIEGEKYFSFKEENLDKKITENMIVNFIAKDKEIVATKLECAKQEACLKKWVFILNTIRDGHVFYRNISKNKTWSE